MPSARLPAPLQVRDPGRYQVVAEHGRGGIGRVVRATDREFGRDVALKELLVRTPVSEVRFLREAVITARLEHPNIVPVHEAGRWPDGTPFYAMKLVSGRPLKSLIDEAKTLPQRLALLDRLLAVVDAIAYAHDRGVIHRDLKPSNIVVGSYGETIVIDWGLAKVITDPDDSERSQGEHAGSDSVELTVAGTVLGTPAYMAPEQAAGEATSERSDVYSLGAILLEILGGKSATAIPTVSSAVSGATTEPGRVELGRLQRRIDADVPPDLLSIAAKAMAKTPEERYPSASLFGDDLRRFVARQPVEAHAYTLRQRSGRWLGAHRRLVQGGAAVLVALLAASVVFLAREASLRGTAESARATAEAARRTAESERDRADRQTVALLEEQGRTELATGYPFRAAPLLAEAHLRDPGNLRVRWLLSEALHSVESLTNTLNVTPPFPANDQLTFSLSLSPDDRELVTGHRFALGFWDPTSGVIKKRLWQPWSSSLPLHARDGSALYNFVGWGGNAPGRIVDATSGRELMAVPTGDADYLVWSGDGQHLATIVRNGRVNVWRAVATRDVLFSFQAAPSPVFGCLAISPDGAVLAARGKGELILASMTTGVLRRVSIIGEDAQSLSFSSDSRLLLSTMADRSVRIWDVASGSALGKLRQQANRPLVAVFSGDGTIIATADSDALHFWDTFSTVPLATVDLPERDAIVAATFAHHSPRLYTANIVGNVRVWDLAGERWAQAMPWQHGRVSATHLADGIRVLSLDERDDGKSDLRIWNTRDRHIESTGLVDWKPTVNVAVSPDGSRILLLTKQGRPQVMDTATRTAVMTLTEPGRSPPRYSSLAFSPDGKWIATVSDAGIGIWSAADGARMEISFGAERGAYLYSASFSPDGSRIVVAGIDRPVRIWDRFTGQLILALAADSASQYARYSPDGHRIITSGQGGSYLPRIWDAATGKLIVVLEGSRDYVVSAAISRDGALAATIDENGVVRIWDTSTGVALRSMTGPTEARIIAVDLAIANVEFSPDGKRLLATGRGYALIWNLELEARRPTDVAAVVAAKSPWHLVDGRLKLSKPVTAP